MGKNWWKIAVIGNFTNIEISSFWSHLQSIATPISKIEVCTSQMSHRRTCNSEPPQNKSMTKVLAFICHTLYILHPLWNAISIFTHSVENTEVFCHYDFTWNQFWRMWKFKRCHFCNFRASEFMIWVNQPLEKPKTLENQNSEPLNVFKWQLFDL